MFLGQLQINALLNCVAEKASQNAKDQETKKKNRKLKKDAEKAVEVDQSKKSRNHLLSALGATDKRTSNSNSNAVDTSNKDENTIAPQLNEPSNNDEQ